MLMSLTPGSRLSAFSTLMPHAPQSMPSTRIRSTFGDGIKRGPWVRIMPLRHHLELPDMTTYMDPVATTGSIPCRTNN